MNNSPNDATIVSTIGTSPSCHEDLGHLLQTTLVTESDSSPKRNSFFSESIKRHVKPKVAFVEPISSLNAEEMLIGTTDSCEKQSNSSQEIDPFGGRQVKSPSTRFPGWGVITDDDEEDDGNTEDNQRKLRSRNSEGDSPKDHQPEVHQETNDPLFVQEFVPATYVQQMQANPGSNIIGTKSNDQASLKSTTSDLVGILTNKPSRAFSTSRTGSELSVQHCQTTYAATAIPNEKKRFRIQQESLQQHSRHTSPKNSSSPSTSRLSAAVFRQPRKSLAMIFSNLSNNLGFTDPPTTGNRKSTSSPAHSTSSSSESNLNMDRRNIQSNKISRSKLLRNVRGTSNSTVIPSGKVDPHTTAIRESVIPHMNGDTRRARGFGMSSLSRTSVGGRGSEAVSSLQPVIDPMTAYPGTGASGTERSLIVDLICCTCCTEVDEDENYSTLIENHRLARLITLVTVLTIMGLILVYVIRSAMETSNEINLASGSPEYQSGQASNPSAHSPAWFNGRERVERVRFPTDGRQTSNFTEPRNMAKSHVV